MNAKSNHNPENLLSLGGSRLNGRAQDCDLTKVIYTKYSKHSNETNNFMGLGRAGRFGQS